MKGTALLMLFAAGAAGAQPPDPPPPVPTPGGTGSPISDPELISALIAVMGDADLAVRQNAALAASELGLSAVEPLTAALKDDVPGRRAGAAYALGQIGRDAQPALSALAVSLGDESLDVRRQASYAIGRILAERRLTEGLESAFGGPR